MNILYLGLTPPPPSSERCILHYPVIRVVPTPQRHIKLSAYSHIILTSKTAVEILAQQITAPPSAEVFAVGQATAAAAARHGFHVAGIAATETAEGVVQLLEQQELSAAHILWPHSARARPIISDYLRDRNASFTEVILYDIELVQSHPTPELENIHEVVFTSPSTVDGFFAIFGSPPPHVKLSCQGPVTAQHLRKRILTTDRAG